MHQSKTVRIKNKNFFFARARICVAGVLIVFIGTVCSIGLIFATEKNREAVARWRKNQQMVRSEISGVEMALITDLKSNASPLVRQGAARALGNYTQNPDVVRALAEALRDEKEKSVRYSCALSLGVLPSFKAFSALERAASDPDPILRRQVAASLKRQRVGATKVRANLLLKKLQKDSDASVRSMASENGQ